MYGLWSAHSFNKQGAVTSIDTVVSAATGISNVVTGSRRFVKAVLGYESQHFKLISRRNIHK